VRIAILGDAAVLHTRRWARGLAEKGNEVGVFSLEAPPMMEGSVESVGYRALPSLPLPGFLRYPCAAPALLRELRAFGPDLIDAHFVPNYGLLGALSGLHPLVVNCWGSDLLLATDPVRKMRVRWVLGRADRIYVDGMNLHREALALGVPGEKIRYQPWGVDTSQFSYSRDSDDRQRARTGLNQILPIADPDVRVVISTRILDPLYDVETLIRAWPDVIARAPRTHLLVVGDGSQRKQLEVLARSQAASETISFIGRVAHDELSGLLAAADIYVSTSRSDSTSISLLEAMSCGCFPIVSDIEGNREWVDEYRARLFAVEDASALAQGIVEALGAEDLEKARRTNRLRVEREADWQTTLNAVVDDYRALLNTDSN
jgi:glycosyltransferase involved in cell wall biosynthesis